MATLPYQVLFYEVGKPHDKRIEYFAKPQNAVKFAVSLVALGSSPSIERHDEKGWNRAADLEQAMMQQVQKKALAAQKKGLRELERLNDLTTVLRPVVKKGPLDREQKLELLQAIIAVHKSLDLEPANTPAEHPVTNIQDKRPENVKPAAPNTR